MLLLCGGRRGEGVDLSMVSCWVMFVNREIVENNDVGLLDLGGGDWYRGLWGEIKGKGRFGLFVMDGEYIYYQRR